MNFEIFFALIGIPILILSIAIICYVHTGVREEMTAMKKEIKKNSVSSESIN
ncbi:hypothetical protein KO561_03060 [Radiobacillus kanasensis]|uniref:hypothetical protein n=1 Tax=Radiobacillus kanasensis TaxID=2844358 RepID=UPI001E46C660|nr:hypothetical protein [Radiobacillus kanasensis]UFT99956.1 hypothetical protein KO561_03060 [Radiobacillus kanasensis]